MEFENYFTGHMIRYCEVCKEVFKNSIEHINHISTCICDKGETCCKCIAISKEEIYLHSEECAFLKKLYFDYNHNENKL